MTSRKNTPAERAEQFAMDWRYSLPGRPAALKRETRPTLEPFGEGSALTALLDNSDGWCIA
jgi:hypothetical protein